MTPELKDYLNSLSITSFNPITNRIKCRGVSQSLSIRRVLKEVSINQLRAINPDNIKYLDFDNMLKDARTYLTEEFKTTVASQSVGDAESEGLRDYVKGLLPVINLADIKNNFLYDRQERGIVHDVDFNTYLAMTGLKVQDIITSGEIANLDFNPFITEPIYMDGVRRYYNLYNPPKWRFIEAPAEIPEIFDKFFKHLFINEESLSFVYHWLYHLIVKRNQTYLCLVGARGIGKGIFSEIAKALVGVKYFESVGDSLLTDKFNSPMKNKRLILLDEITIDGQEKFNKLKSFANDLIPFETKGKDSVTGVNYTSMILATNHITGIEMGPSERRFSIPEMTDVDLRNSTVFPKERIDELVELLREEDSVEIAMLGNWLLKYGFNPKYKNEFHAYKGKYFYEICYINLKDWQKFVVDTVLLKERNIIILRDLAQEYRDEVGDKLGKYFPSTKGKAFLEFINDYAHEGLHRLGKLVEVKIESKSYLALKVNEVFAPEGGIEYSEVTNYSPKEENSDLLD